MGKMKTKFVGESLDDKKKVSKKTSEKKEKVHLSGSKGGERVKVIGDDLPQTNEKVESAAEETSSIKTKKASPKKQSRSKKYQEAKAGIAHDKYYKVSEAVELVKKASYSKFDGTMELHLVVKKVGTSAQIKLPYQAGKEKKVEIASETTIEDLKKGKIDFDVLVTTPAMMPKLVPFARLLGPKGLMPNPKNGTLIADPKKLKSFSTATITLKTEKDAPLIHTVVGKVSQKDKEIVENVEAIFKAIGGDKQIVRAFLKSTMSPSAKLLLK